MSTPFPRSTQRKSSGWAIGTKYASHSCQSQVHSPNRSRVSACKSELYRFYGVAGGPAEIEIIRRNPVLIRSQTPFPFDSELLRVRFSSHFGSWMLQRTFRQSTGLTHPVFKNPERGCHRVQMVAVPARLRVGSGLDCPGVAGCGGPHPVASGPSHRRSRDQRHGQ